MFSRSRIGTGKLIYRDQERNVSLGVFENKNVRGTRYGKISIVVLSGGYKGQIDISIPELERLKILIKRMPEIKVKQKEQE